MTHDASEYPPWFLDILSQKSSVMIRSGTRYRRPLIRTSSTLSLGGTTTGAGAASVLVISMMPLFHWRGLVISIGVALARGMRRLGS